MDKKNQILLLAFSLVEYIIPNNVICLQVSIKICHCIPRSTSSNKQPSKSEEKMAESVTRQES